MAASIASSSVVSRSSFLAGAQTSFRGDAVASTPAAGLPSLHKRILVVRANKNVSNKPKLAQGAQRIVGYKGSTMPGSAPTRRDGKPGVVFRLKGETGRENVDEYSPIFTPEKWSTTGETYAPGLAGLALWAATFVTIIGGAAFLVINTSALGA